MSDFRVDIEQALDPLVLAIDVGSTATRAGIYDAAGRPVRGYRHKIPHAFTSAHDGTSTIDADQVVDEIVQVIGTIVRRHQLLGRMGAVALDTFSSSLVGVGPDGAAITPCFTYADSRCAPQAAALRGELDEAAVQERTGTRIHTSYLPARLRWISETDPETFAAVRRWMSLGEYVHLRLLGETAAGTSVAAWTGMLNRRTGKWDATMLRAAGVTRTMMSPINDPDQPLHPVADNVKRAWPALADVPWMPAISDGFASNLGAGAADSTTVVASCATSGAIRVLVEGAPKNLPSGLWCYRVDRKRSLVGGALNDVGRAVTWAKQAFALPEDERTVSKALLADPTHGTPVVLPFFTGERSTGWKGAARAVFAQVDATTTATQMLRGTVEGVALAYARVAAELATVAGRPETFLASGRVLAEVPELPQLLCDALDTPVIPVTIKRSTLHGTALHALEVIAPKVARAPADHGPTFTPGAGRAEYYAGRAKEFEALYVGAL